MNKLLAKLLNKPIYNPDSKEETTFNKEQINQNSFNGTTANQQALHNKVTELINNILKDDLPSEVKGIAFILHSDSKINGNWISWVHIIKNINR